MCMLLFSLWKNATETCSRPLRFGRRSGREGTGTAEAFKSFVVLIYLHLHFGLLVFFKQFAGSTYVELLDIKNHFIHLQLGIRQ